MKRSSFQKLLEKIPAIMSWGILLLPLVFSFSHPIAVVFFLTIFVFLWFFRTLEYIYYLVFSFWKFKKISKQDFSALLSSWETGKNLPEPLAQRWKEHEKKGILLQPSAVKHGIIIATCGEDEAVLVDTIESVKNSNFSMENVFLILATEARMEPESRKIAESLQKKYDGIFSDFFHFAHPDGIPGEVRGKGGNITFAGQEFLKEMEKKGEKIENILVTTLDADNRPDTNYLASLTLAFAEDDDRQHKSYQPLPLFYNNIWEVPLINRMISIAGGFWHMVESARPYRLHNFSSHAQPLWALKEMNFWATDTIVEDGHQFWRSYFHFHSHYEVVPLFVPIYQDAVMNSSYPKTLVAQYKQIRRWAWGCSDIPFVLMAWHKNFDRLPFWETFRNFLQLLEAHVFWATGAIVVTMATPVPRLLNPEYAVSGYASSMAQMLSFFFNGAIVGMFLIILLSFITLPKPPKKISYVVLLVQWIFMPIMTILFGAIPALEAQTRLFFGKYLGFNVTEKIRKE